MWFKFKLPIFGLIDGDAYGIDILLTYKYGSLNSAYQNYQLIVPAIKWLGINSNDILEFNLKGTVFNENELNKFNHLQNRPDVLNDQSLMEEIYNLKQIGFKVELESLLDYSNQFLLDCYLPYKIYYKKWK